MSDVKDILGVSSQVKDGLSNAAVDNILKGKKVVKTPSKESTPRGGSIMDKLQHTFRNLEGETISFALPVAQAFKEKRKIKVNYEKRGFRNSARKDNLILYHWVKSSEKIDDYKFVKFNKRMEVLLYTEEEYDLYLRDTQWSREDTDQLIDLCKRYDTRFIIVNDRFTSTTPRTIEDLKERYYKIQSKLVELRTKPEEDPYHNPLTGYTFNKSYETERKLQSDKLFQLSKKQIEEEDMLAEKYDNIERHLLKHSKESKSIMKMANLAITYGPLKNYNQQDLVPSTPENKKSKKRKSTDPSLSSSVNSTPTTTGLDDKSPALSSSKSSNRVESALFEMHIGQPYSNAVAKRFYGDLKQDIGTLFYIQRYYMEKRYHCEILKSQKEYLEKEIAAMNIPAEALAIHIEEEDEKVDTTGTEHHLGQPSGEPTPFQLYSGAGIVEGSSVGSGSGGQSSSSTRDGFQLSSSSNNLNNNNILSSSTQSTNTIISSNDESSHPIITPLKKSKKKSTSSSSVQKGDDHGQHDTEHHVTAESSTPSSTTTTPSSTKKKKSAPKKKEVSSAVDNFTINIDPMSEGETSTTSTTSTSTTTTPKSTRKSTPKSKKSLASPESTEEKKPKKSSTKKKESTSKKKSSSASSTPTDSLPPLSFSD